jgi:hypothetical protein
MAFWAKRVQRVNSRKAEVMNGWQLNNDNDGAHVGGADAGAGSWPDAMESRALRRADRRSGSRLSRALQVHKPAMSWLRARSPSKRRALTGFTLTHTEQDQSRYRFWRSWSRLRVAQEPYNPARSVDLVVDGGVKAED